ncbi:MAG: hypothetical protein WC733_03660 [Methylophilus sp.]|jgi:hypothetical protein
MREKIAALLFIMILAFVAVFSADVFNKLFIQVDSKFSETASAAFLGAFLAFLFVRIGDFFKAYSDSVTKNHSALIKLEHSLNSLLGTLDDNIYVIETFESLYAKNINKANQTHVFVWANKLHPVRLIDELILDLLNIDLVNELFSLNTHLRKFNDSAETINGAYIEAKDALISGKIDADNYINNLHRIHKDLVDIKYFISSYIRETTESLSAIRVLAKKRPLMGYILRRVAGHKYSSNFESKRLMELSKLEQEMKEIKQSSGKKIESVLNESKK